MKIRIATKAWNHSVVADTRDEADVGIRTMWVELDGHRTNSALDATVKTNGEGVTTVTITFLAAAEMVLLGKDGEILE